MRNYTVYHKTAEERFKTIGVSLVGGILITLFSGLISTNALLGGPHYGLPLTWLYRLVLAPEYNLWMTSRTGIVFDVVFWAIMVFAFLSIYDKRKK